MTLITLPLCIKSQQQSLTHNGIKKHNGDTYSGLRYGLYIYQMLRGKGLFECDVCADLLSASALAAVAVVLKAESV